MAPRFYCTDYAAMENIDIEPVRAEWDLMMRDFELDKNRGHFKQNYEYDPNILESDQTASRTDCLPVGCKHNDVATSP